MSEASNPDIIIVDVVINKDKISATDVRNKKYKIQSITLGIGRNRKSIPYDKHLTAGCECRAEILTNGKLNIL